MNFDPQMSRPAPKKWSLEKFGEELPRLQEKILPWLINKTKSRYTAEDIAQETMLKAWKAYETQFSPVIDMEKDLLSWMFRIARNEWITVCRKAGREPGSSIDDDANGIANIIESKGSQQDIILHAVEMEEAMASLPKDQQEVMQLVIKEGLSYEEAGEKLGVTIGTIKSRLWRGREHLAEGSPVRKLERVTKTSNDPGPELMFIKISKYRLKVNEKYQRSLMSSRSQKNIVRIATEFTWSGCSALIVVEDPEQKGYFWVIDGQHRWAATLLRGDLDLLPCLVGTADTLADQVDAFLKINERRVNLSPIVIFNAKVLQGDPSCVGLAKAVEAAGVSITKNPKPNTQLGVKETTALGALQRIYNGKGGAACVTRTLATITAAYSTKRGQLTASMIRAVAELVRWFSREDIIKALRKTDDPSLNAIAYQDIAKNGSKHQDAYTEALRAKVAAEVDEVE